MELHEWHSDKVAISDSVTIRINYDFCAGHGNCEEVCPSEVYALVDGKAAAEGIDGCIECCACVENCPESAINHSTCG